MKTILVTGATGNIGSATLRALHLSNTGHRIVAAVRNTDKAKKQFTDCPSLHFVKFDFEDASRFDEALSGIDSVFVIRPPQLSDVASFFPPLVDAMLRNGVREVVFLSVQGVETSSVIPHHKMEALIRSSGLDYAFLRPGYFMQNLTGALRDDIKLRNEIVLPSGRAVFNWVDANDIGEAAARVLTDFTTFRNMAFDLTGSENATFGEVVGIQSEVLQRPIGYTSINPVRFYFMKRKQGAASGLALVMLMLHFLPRFQKPPAQSTFLQSVLGRRPTTLRAFVERERKLLE